MSERRFPASSTEHHRGGLLLAENQQRGSFHSIVRIFLRRSLCMPFNRETLGGFSLGALFFFEKLPRHAYNRKGDKTNRGSCHRLKKAFNNMGYSVCNCAQSGMKCQILLTFVSISYLCTAKDSRTS